MTLELQASYQTQDVADKESAFKGLSEPHCNVPCDCTFVMCLMRDVLLLVIAT